MEKQEAKPDWKPWFPVYGILKISDEIDKSPIRAGCEIIYQSVIIGGLIIGIGKGLETLLK